MIKNFRLLFLIILPIFCFSQNMPKIIKPSPEAANLSRYADVPVSLYTGKPQIDFPLYTLKCGTLELPISLSYYASGVKVEDYPTWAGIGWALNAGGVITAIESSTAMAVGGDLPITGSAQERFNKLSNFVLPGSRQNVIYHYNFLQYSGSFQIGNNGPVFRKHANLKIEFSNGVGIEEFITITDDNGNKYLFENRSTDPNGAKTDYYLVKIESADKLHSIHFEYILGDWYQKPPHNSVFYTVYPGANYLKTSEQNSETLNSGSLLSKIYTSNNDSVEFIKKNITIPNDNGPNPPFDSRKALDSILIYQNSDKISSFHFKTNNIQTTKLRSGPYSDQFPASNWGSKEMDYRLYLDGFEKIDSEGNSIESYGFNYYGRTTDGKDSIPNRFSLAQDLGGFYNGQDNNTSLIPPLNQTLHPDTSGLSDGSPVNYPATIDVNILGANRHPNLQCMTMGTLKTIKYPTGGTANFYYSQLENPLTLEPYLGLKIDKIEYLDSDGSLQKNKKYVYDYPVLGNPIPSFWHYTLYNDYNGLVLAPFQTLCGSSLNNPINCDAYRYSWGWAIELSPDPVNNLELNEGPMIGYGLVTEFEEGNGRIEHQFSTDGAFDEKAEDHYFQIDGFDSLNTFTLITKNSWPTGPFATSNNWKMGTLLNETTYSEDGSKKQDIHYHYTYETLELIPAINVFGVGIYNSLGNYVYPNTFYYQEFAYLSTWERLDSITETIDDVTKVTNYNYDDHKQVSQISTKKSNGDLLTINFTHPYDYSSAVYSNMVARNILAPVIEKTETTNTTQTELVKTNYSFWTEASGNMTPFTNATNHIYPSSVEVKKGESPIQTRLNYNSYDNKGNITSVSKNNDVEVLYIWGYNSKYPIAKIENATYASIPESLITAAQNASDSGTEVSLLIALTAIRTALPNAMVATYTYKPLIGISTITDPKGDIVTYTYDSFSRLQNVKDKNGNILSENEYHYKN